MTQNYLPKDEPGIAGWFQNWAEKMAESGANFGFSAAEIAETQSDAATVVNIVNGGAGIEAYRSEYVGFKRIMLYGAKNAPTPAYPVLTAPVAPFPALAAAGIIQRTRSFVRRLKESKNYNEAVGADFRVLPVQEEGVSELEAKPVIKLRAMADGTVDVEFVRGQWDGIELEMSRGSDVNAWTRLGNYYRSPAEDDTAETTPNTPEKRRYRARFLKGNKPIGIYSADETIVTI